MNKVWVPEVSISIRIQRHDAHLGPDQKGIPMSGHLHAVRDATDNPKDLHLGDGTPINQLTEAQKDKMIAQFRKMLDLLNERWDFHMEEEALETIAEASDSDILTMAVTGDGSRPAWEACPSVVNPPAARRFIVETGADPEKVVKTAKAEAREHAQALRARRSLLEGPNGRAGGTLLN